MSSMHVKQFHIISFPTEELQWYCKFNLMFANTPLNVYERNNMRSNGTNDRPALRQRGSLFVESEASSIWLCFFVVKSERFIVCSCDFFLHHKLRRLWNLLTIWGNVVCLTSKLKLSLRFPRLIAQKGMCQKRISGGLVRTATFLGWHAN